MVNIELVRLTILAMKGFVVLRPYIPVITAANTNKAIKVV